MASTSPKLMEPAEAARALEAALSGKGTDFTIADAAAKSGLPLRDAETGLHALVSEYRGHLRVTADGDLLFRFPSGFTKPWETRDRLREIGRRVGRGALGVARFVVRAWISIVLVGYALVFLGLMLALMFARDSRDSRSGIGFELGYVFFRVVADALFWTFHPFSPFAYVDYGAPERGRRRRKKDETPFYEKVNRFFFGPQVPEPDPRAMERRILAEIRAQKGRVGLADVIRVTGLPREEADPLMARLMLDYDGTVEVSEEGGIVYRFESLRKTADAEATSRPKPIWARLKRLVPLTGNTGGTNLLIAGLNGFNLIMSWYALSNHLTFDKIAWLVDVAQHRYPIFLRPEAPPESTAIALGVVPLVFSLALFAVPLVRMAIRPLKEKRIARENGRRAMLREILENVGKGGVTEEALKTAWKDAAGTEPDPKELTREVVALGGDVDYESGKVQYRFADFESEAKAVEAEREAAAESEAKLGEVVFSSEN
ncbi:MAG: hypothetical protein QM820_38020 [Minicystis sp.]